MTNESSTDRRRFLGFATLAGVAAALPTAAPADTTAGTYASVEADNRLLVEQFCEAWSRLDLDRIVSLISEDFVYQAYDDAPLTRGVAEFRAYIKPFLDNSREIRFEILRTSVIGPVVVNERIDHLLAKPGGKDMSFPIAGVFHVVNGRIRLWYDYFMPGFKMDSPAPT